MNDWIDLTALAKILIGGLVCGAGLPAVFALGLRALRVGAPAPAAAGAGDASGDRVTGGSPLGMAAATVCFAVVLAAVGWGIYWIVSSS